MLINVRKRSEQLQVVMNLTKKYRPFINKAIINYGDTFARADFDGLKSEIFYDGIYDPWDNYCEYTRLVEYEGNTHDETSFINRYIIKILSSKNPKKYSKIIDELKRIEKEGL
jgi:hypothetical protein